MINTSIIVPCYNEQDTIILLLDAIYQQSYPREEMEVIIADGMSEDSTISKVEEFRRNRRDLVVKVVENPDRSIPSALNRAISNAEGEFIIRLDAHSIPYQDYVEKCVNDLRENRGDNVGGKWEIKPGADDWIARSIAVAAAHPLGAGDAKYRIGGSAQYVDTVPFGAFRKSLYDSVGKFNEKLLTNEDYEYNSRIRMQGGKVWFDPNIRSIYFARKNLKDLANQYWRYGYWKGRMIHLFPNTLRWRQLLPPMFILSIIIGVVISLLYSIIWFFVAIEIGIYIIVLLVIAGIEAVKKKDFSLFVGFPLTMIIMHVCWGTSFLWSMIKPYGKSTN